MGDAVSPHAMSILVVALSYPGIYWIVTGAMDGDRRTVSLGAGVLSVLLGMVAWWVGEDL